MTRSEASPYFFKTQYERWRGFNNEIKELDIKFPERERPSRFQYLFPIFASGFMNDLQWIQQYSISPFNLGTLDNLRGYVLTSSASPTKFIPGSAPSLYVAKRNRNGPLRRPGFSTNTLATSLQSSLVLSSSIILRMLVAIGMSTFLISASSASICRRSFSSYHCDVILQLLLLLRPSLPIILFNYNSVVDDPRQKKSLNGSTSSFWVLVGMVLLGLHCLLNEKGL